MKYCIEFGVRGGECVETIILHDMENAAKLASSLIRVFENSKESPSSNQNTWHLARNEPRKSWTSSEHYVALSKLDGIDRGAASSKLWRKDE